MYNQVDVGGLVAAASNIKSGENPSFTVADFLTIYPQFGPGPDAKPAPIITEILQIYIDLAHACIRFARWKTSWRIGMSLFVAHFATIYLQSVAAPGSTAAQVVAAGQSRGLLTSKSVGDVSVSYESIASDIDGWAAYKLTAFGQQLATLGKLMGKGGMYVW